MPSCITCQETRMGVGAPLALRWAMGSEIVRVKDVYRIGPKQPVCKRQCSSSLSFFFVSAHFRPIKSRYGNPVTGFNH